MLELPVYMDNHATTRTDPRVLDVMWPFFSKRYGNAASVHRFGQDAAKAVEAAREQADRPELKAIVTNRSDPLTKNEKIVCSLVQLFGFCHFLFRCCCLTLIKPVRETWAFDMFQSLNATGTPLTAVETFKPLVVNKFGGTFKGSAAEANLQRVDKLLDAFKSAVQKGKLTNEVLTTFAIVYDGSKLGKQFSVQRAKLIQALSHDVSCSTDSCSRNSSGVSLRNSQKLNSGNFRPSRPYGA